MIRSPAGFDGGDRIKRYLDYYQPSYGVTMLSSSRFSPLSLFANGAQGAWYDPSDLTTLYQDAAGTTPVTAVDQSVGLALDKSQGLVLGPEVLVNGDFNTDTVWSKGIGWTISGGQALYNGFATNLTQTSVVEDGKSYRVTVDVASISGPFTVRAGAGGFSATTSFSLSAGIVTATVLSDGPNITIRSDGGTTIAINSISVKELSGNHARQGTSNARPIFKATSRVDFDGSDDKWTTVSSGGGTTGFLFVSGVNIDATGATYTLWSDTGTNTGYRVRINSSNQLELSAGNGSAYTTVATTETLSAGTSYVVAAWQDGTNLNVRLNSNGALASQAFATATAGTAGFTVGMDNGAVSSQLNGKLYNIIYVKNFSGSAADVNNTINYVSGTTA